MTPAPEPGVLIVKRIELLEALARRTKMKRAPAGATSTGLKEVAFIPAIGGFRVEMPGGAHFVWAIAGELSDEVCFHPKFIDGLLKILTSQTAETASILVIDAQIEFKCEGSKLRIPLIAPKTPKSRSRRL